MKKLILAALLALPNVAQAVCTNGGAPFNLEVPSLGDSASVWSACVRRDLIKISTGAMPVTGSTLTVPSWVAIQVSTIQARNGSGIYIASTTVVGSSMSVTAGAGLDVWYGFRAATMTATGLITGSSMTATGTGGPYAITTSTGIRLNAGNLSLGDGGVCYDDGTCQTTAAGAGSSPFSASFDSDEVTFTANSSTFVAHGLGGLPKFCTWMIKNENTECGYAVGDEVQVTNTDDGDSVYRSGNWFNATNVGTEIGSRPFLIETKPTGGFCTATAANWRLRFRCYR